MTEDITPGFTFKFHEGYSNAVRYDLKMDYFFRSININA